MGDTPLTVLWLCGARGVGRSTTGWRVFRGSAGLPVAYVDVDQVGIVWPPPEGDPTAPA